MAERGSRDILWQPSSLRRDAVRHALAAALVLAAVGGAAFASNHLPQGDAAGEVDDAVLLDLPPALASSTPLSEAAEGPEQQAMEASAPVETPKEVAPDPKPDDAPKDAPQDTPPKQVLSQAPAQPEPPPPEPPPVAPRPAAVLPPPDQPPPPPVKTPADAAPPPVAAAPAQEEMAPAGSQAPVPEAEPVDSEAARRRAAHALSRWQQAMLVRLQLAKSGLRAAGQTGTATVAFAIDRRGRLLTSRIAHSSGSSRLDQAALSLLARAAPFPDPPTGARDDALQFTVPVAFAARR